MAKTNLDSRKNKTTTNLVDLDTGFSSFQTLNRLDTAVVLIDREWKYHFLNDAALKLKSFSREELTGRVVWDVHPELIGTKFALIYQEVMSTNKPAEMEEYYSPLKAWFRVNIYPSAEGLTVVYSDITNKKNSENHREFSDSIINSSMDAIISRDLDGNITSWNKGSEKIFGYKEEEVLGKRLLEFTPEHLRLEEKEILKKVFNGESIINFESERINKNGEHIFISVAANPIKNSIGKITGISAIARNVTNEREAISDLKKSQRLYAFLSAINQSIVHIQDENELLDEACKIALKQGGYFLAWIGLLNESGELNVGNLHGSKLIKERMEKIPNLDYSNPPLSKTPTGKVLKTGEYSLCNDLQNDPDMTLWTEEFKRFGIKSTIIFPIKKFGETIGVFGFYSTELNNFEKTEIKLLAEATADISFGIERIRSEEKRKQAENELRQNKIILDASEEMARLGSIEIDLLTGKRTWSAGQFRLFGYEPNEVEPSQELYIKHLHPEDFPRVSEKYFEDVKLYRNSTDQFRILTKEGDVKFIFGSIKFIYDENGVAKKLQATSQDITQLLETQDELLKSKVILDASQEMANVGSSVVDMETLSSMWSDEQFKILGYEPNEVEATMERYLAHIHPEEVEEKTKLFFEVFNEKKDGNEQYRIVTKSGEVKYISGQIKFEFDKNGVAKKMFGTTQDVTKKVEVENRLKYSEIFSRAVIDSMSSHVGVLDKVGNIIAVNKAWKEFGEAHQTKVLPRMSVGENLFEKFEQDWNSCDDYSKKAILEMKEVLKGKKDFVKIEYPCHSPQTENWFNLRIMKFDENNDLIVVAHENITNVKLAERERDATLSELESRVLQRTSELNEINISLTDSINYAKRIQLGVLTSPVQLKEIFPKSFLLSKACNILSGDFFWCLERDNLKFIALADCTGHGVPGALMSLVGNTLLNRILKEGELRTDPAKILSKLDKGLLRTLSGDDERKVMDGMDIAICVINTQEKTIEFAGAMLPMMILGTDGKLLEIQGGRSCIGRDYANQLKSFENHTFNYKTGQTLYLSSDGYQSQFGGVKGKKLMKRGLKSLIQNLKDTPVENQSEHLEKEFAKWQGDESQVDDVLVVGIELE